MKSFKNLFIASLLLFASCAAQQQKEIVVGTEGKYPPFEYLENGKLTGFDIDLFTAIAKEANISFKFFEMDFDGLIPALQTKKIDAIIAGMTVTEARKKSVLFSDNYFHTDGQVIGVPTGTQGIAVLDDLKGKKVGVVIGYIADTIMTEKGTAEIQRFNNAAGMILALQSKKIDAFVLDSIPAKEFQKANPGIALIDAKETAEDYAMAFRPDDKPLADKINKGLAAVKAKGIYDELYKKYIHTNQ